MKQLFNKTISLLLSVIMVLTLLPSLTLQGQANEGDPVLAMSVANKIDVALAVGPTSVDYSAFEADLRKALKYEADGITLRAHPVPDEDVYIMASKAVSAATTSEFSWWVYDHTRPVATYGGSRSIDGETRVYMEPLGAVSTSTATAAYLSTDATVGIWGPKISSSATTATAATSINYFGGTNYVPGIGYQYTTLYNGITNPNPVPNAVENPDPTNPDLQYYNTSAVTTQTQYNANYNRRLYHPYQGNNVHMLSSNNGAQMDFYGYPNYSYKDFRYLPNDQKTVKIFEFAIAEDAAYDALDGVGFFFNTIITEGTTTYEGTSANQQLMSGYLLFLAYYNAVTTSTQGLGRKMSLYKFENINVEDFHHKLATTTTNGGTIDTAYFATNFKDRNGRSFVEIASAAYPQNDKSRRIKIEAAPDKVQVWYVGSLTKNHTATLTTAIDDYATPVTPVNWTIQAGGVLPASGSTPAQTSGSITSSVRLDTSIIKNYGFGPMASYIGHGCARPTHIALQNLSMTVEVVKTLTEVVREPEWHENTIKYLVNLNEHTIKDFDENAVIAELLARLTNDDIYYIGWGATENAIASAEFLRKHSLKGTIVDIEALDKLLADPDWNALDQTTKEYFLESLIQANNPAFTYKEQIQAIADEIYKRYWNQADEEHALVTDNVVMTVTGADTQNTADALWQNGKWMIEHIIDEGTIKIGGDIPTYMTNFEGKYAYSGQYMADLEPSYVFPLPGLYRIYYREVQIGELIVHRKPVASFEITCDNDGTNVIVVNNSYDPDVYDTLGTNGAERGIKTSSFNWIDLDDPSMLVPESGIPEPLKEGHNYLVTLTVEDEWGATDSISRLITYSESSEVVLPPFGDFTLTPVNLIKTNDPLAQAAQKITLNNKSYDPARLPITSKWEVYKDGALYTGLVITDGDFSDNTAGFPVGTLPAGSYKVVLIVNNGKLDSAPVAKFFNIVEDLILPTAAISPAAPQTFIGNTNLGLNFSDTGGSEFESARFAVVTVGSSDPEPLAPVSGDSVWKSRANSPSRNVLVNAVGANYVFWEAWDNAGNYASGVFGPYTMTKKEISLNLTAAPEFGASQVVYGSPDQRITLTATLTVGAEDAAPTGTVYFYQGDVVPANNLGSGTVNASGVATWTGYPLSAGYGQLFTAVYQGDSNYNTKEATAYRDVLKNPDASVSIGEQTDRQYDGTAYVATGVTVTQATTFKVEYAGRGGTTYAKSIIPPTNAGEYTVIVTTTDGNYEEKSDSADFEITKRELTLTLTPTPDPGDGGEALALSTVTLKATVENAVDLPPGKLEFYVDGSLLDVISVSAAMVGYYDDPEFPYTIYTYIMETDEWSGMIAGDYELTLKYVPAASDNYTAADFTILEYNIEKLDQTIDFTDVSPLDKTYGGANFTVEATGGGGTGTVTYEVTSGSGVVEVDPDTGDVTILKAGTAIITATKASDESYNLATATLTICVGKKAGNFEVSLYEDEIEFGDPVTPQVDVNEGGGTVTYIYEGTGGTFYGPDNAPPTELGTYKVTATAAETVNYQSVNGTAAFSIVPCGCAITYIDFDGATITIPYYDVQSFCVLTAEAVFDSCGRSGHNYSFEYTFEIANMPPGSAIIDDGKLLANDLAVGNTIEVKVTATHVPTGHTDFVYAYFDVVKGVKPAEPSADGTDGSGVIDKNEDDSVTVDISTLAPGSGSITVTYSDGPANNSDLRGLLAPDTDYEIDDGTIVFTGDFIALLYAGEHEFLINVNGKELTFYLYIAEGDVIVEVNYNDASLPKVTVGSTDDLKAEEKEKPDTIEQMELGYDVYVRIIVDAASDLNEQDIIEAKKGDKKIGAILDIKLKKMIQHKVGGESDEFLKEIKEAILLTIDIPNELQGKGYTFYVVRAHTADGGDLEYELLPATVINGGAKLQFSSDRFSTFAILYAENTYKPPVDNKPPSETPGEKPAEDNSDKAPDEGPADNKQDNRPDVSDNIREAFEIEDHIKYINGYTDGTVGPDKAITRAEASAIFFRLLKNPAKNSPVNVSFSDVPDDSWYAQSVKFLAKLGVLKGYEDGTFRPDQNITRAEFAAIASRFDKLEGDTDNPFTDVTEGHWAYMNILLAYSKGWVNGYPDGRFEPQNSITRAEAIAAVNRMLGRGLEKADVPGALYVLYSDLTAEHWAFAAVIEASVGHEYEKKADGNEIWIAFDK